MKPGRAGVLIALMADQTVISLVERVAHRAALVGKLESVAAAKLALGTAHDVVQLWLGMDQVNKVLIIESMRRAKAVPALCFFEKRGGRPGFDQMKSGLDDQEIAGRVLLNNVIRE